MGYTYDRSARYWYSVEHGKIGARDASGHLEVFWQRDPDTGEILLVCPVCLRIERVQPDLIGYFGGIGCMCCAYCDDDSSFLLLDWNTERRRQ